MVPTEKIKVFCFLSLGVFMTLNLDLRAQTSVSMLECLERAKTSYPFIKSKHAQVLAEEERLRSSKTEYLPAFLIGGQINYGTSNSIPGAYYPNEGLSTGISGGIRPDNISTAVYGSFGTLEVDWRIFNFGKVTANVATARAAAQTAQADFANEVFQHQIRTIDAYLLALVAEKITRVQKSNYERAKQIHAITRAEAISGLKAGADSSFAAAEVSKAKILFLEGERNERAQRIRLSELIGEKNSNIELDTTYFLNAIPFAVMPDTASIAASPTLKLYRSQMEFRRSRSVAIKRSYAPSVLFSGIGFGRGSGISRVDDSFKTDFSSGVGFQALNFLAVVSFRFNILNYSKVHHDFKAEKFEFERTRHLYDEAALRAGKQLELADMQTRLAIQQASEAPVQLNAARAAYAQSNARYQSGLASLAELAQNFYILNRAEVDKSVAINNVWRALLLESAATGNLGYFIDQVK